MRPGLWPSLTSIHPTFISARGSYGGSTHNGSYSHATSLLSSGISALLRVLPAPRLQHANFAPGSNNEIASPLTDAFGMKYLHYSPYQVSPIRRMKPHEQDALGR